MRIAYVSGAYVPSRGADSMHAMRMCQALAQLGHEVTLHARPGGDVSDDFAHYGVERCFRIVKTARPQVRAWGALVNAWRTRKAVKKDPLPDLVFARELWALSLVSRTGIPFVFESHWKPKSRFRRAVEGSILRHPNCRGLIVISDELRKIYEQELPAIPASRVIVAHDGADPVSMPAARSVPGSDRLQVGYVGSFQQGAGVELIRRLAIEVPACDFHVVGGSPEGVEGARRRDRDVENLRYHGFVPPCDLPSIYDELDVLLAPYQASTRHIRWISPMKLFEYMAHGKPVICSDFPVMREIVVHGGTGLLVPPADPGAWVRALASLQDGEFRDRLGAAGRARLEAEFTWSIRAQRILSFVARRECDAAKPISPTA